MKRYVTTFSEGFYRQFNRTARNITVICLVALVAFTIRTFYFAGGDVSTIENGIKKISTSTVVQQKKDALFDKVSELEKETIGIVAKPDAKPDEPAEMVSINDGKFHPALEDTSTGAIWLGEQYENRANFKISRPDGSSFNSFDEIHRGQKIKIATALTVRETLPKEIAEGYYHVVDSKGTLYEGENVIVAGTPIVRRLSDGTLHYWVEVTRNNESL